jgi:hypothetical protein
MINLFYLVTLDMYVLHNSSLIWFDEIKWHNITSSHGLDKLTWYDLVYSLHCQHRVTVPNRVKHRSEKSSESPAEEIYQIGS